MARKIKLDSTENDPVRLYRLSQQHRSLPDSVSVQRDIVRMFHENLRVGKDEYVAVDDAINDRIYNVAERLVSKAKEFIGKLCPAELQTLKRLDALRMGQHESIDSICTSIEDVPEMDQRIEYAITKEYQRT